MTTPRPRQAGEIATRSAAARLAGPIGADSVRATHRAGEHHGRLDVEQQVEGEGGVLEGVGAMHHHDAYRAIRHACPDGQCDRGRVGQADLRAGHGLEIERLYGGYRRRAVDHGHDLGRRQRHTQAAVAAAHRDGAAQADHQDFRWSSHSMYPNETGEDGGVI